MSLSVVPRDVGASTSDDTVLVLSGPNLNRLGLREPAIYGSKTLDQIHARLAELGRELGVRVDARQSNHEGELIDWIHEAADRGYLGICINPGAYTHTSIALHDALKSVPLPAVELHLSNPDAREPFRRRSYVASVVVGRIAGFGAASYELALRALVLELQKGR